MSPPHRIRPRGGRTGRPRAGACPRIANAFLLLAALLAVATAAEARIWIVDPAGHGDAASIGAALARASAGDEVVVRPGTYRENLIMKTGVRLRSTEGPDRTRIENAGDQLLTCWSCQEGTLVEGFTFSRGGHAQRSVIYVSGSSHVEIASCVLSGNAPALNAAVQVQQNSYAHVHDCRFLDNTALWTAAVCVMTYSRLLLEDCEFRGNFSEFKTSCVAVNRGQGEIRRCVFVDNVSFHDGTVSGSWSGTYLLVESCSFVGNACRADGSPGLYAHDGARIEAERNLLVFNTGGAAVKLTDGRLDLRCNLFWNNERDAEGCGRPAGRDGNLAADPRLRLPLGAVTPVAPDSPCLGSPCGEIGARPEARSVGAILTKAGDLRAHLDAVAGHP